MVLLPRRRDDPQGKLHPPFSRRSPRKTPQDEDSRLCAICATEKPGSDYMTIEESPCGCNRACRQCTVRYLTMQVETQPGMPLARMKLACVNCSSEWPFEQACKLLPRDVAALYDSILAQQCMEAIPGFLLCPYPDCSAGAIHDTSCADFPCVRCHACSRSSCQACRTMWQQDHSCAEFSSSSEASRRTVRSLMEAGARHCPNCHYVVVKNGGCSNIHCRCGATFPWKWKGKLVDEGSDPDFPMLVGPTRSEQFQSALRALLTRFRRRVQRVLSKPARVAVQKRL